MIATLSSTDADSDVVNFTLSNAGDGWAVSILENKIYLKQHYYHDHEGNPLEITVLANDGTVSTEKSFEFASLNVDEAPNWPENVRSNNNFAVDSINEDIPSQKAGGFFNASDPEGDTFYYLSLIHI